MSSSPSSARSPSARAKSPALGLLDIRKARGDVLLDCLASQLLERLPDVEIKRYAKPTFAKPAPDELRRQILEEVDFVVEGLAD